MDKSRLDLEDKIYKEYILELSRHPETMEICEVDYNYSPAIINDILNSEWFKQNYKRVKKKKNEED